MFVLDPETGLYFLRPGDRSPGRYTTDGTVPEGLEGIWRGWQSAWRRIRSRNPDRKGRGLELRTGFLVRCHSFPDLWVKLWLRKGPDQWFSADGLQVRLTGSRSRHEAVVPGSCGFNDSKPYLRIDELRRAAEFLLTEEVMSA